MLHCKPGYLGLQIFSVHNFSLRSLDAGMYKVIINNNRSSTATLCAVLDFCQDSYYESLDLPKEKKKFHQHALGKTHLYIEIKLPISSLLSCIQFKAQNAQ